MVWSQESFHWLVNSVVILLVICQLSRDVIGYEESTCDWCISIAICVWSVLCEASLKRTRTNRDANIRTCIRRRAVEFNPDLNRVLNKISYLGSCIWQEPIKSCLVLTVQKCFIGSYVNPVLGWNINWCWFPTRL